MKKNYILIILYFFFCISSVCVGYLFQVSINNKILHWDQGTINFYISSNVSSDYSTAIQNAFEVWNKEELSNITFEYSGETSNSDFGLSDNNIIFLEENSWDFSTQGDSLAFTALYYYEDTGVVFGADIAINGVDVQWSTNGSANTFDLQSVITHEVGHFLAFEHVYEDNNSIMAQNISQGITKHTLSDDDINAITTLYPLSYARQTGNAGNTSAQLIPVSNKYYNGQKLILDAVIDGRAAVDIYLVMLFPDGSFKSYLADQTWSDANQANKILEAWIPIPGRYNVLEIDIPEDWTAGTYFWYAVLTEPYSNPLDTTNWIYVDTKEVQILDQTPPEQN